MNIATDSYKTPHLNYRFYILVVDSLVFIALSRFILNLRQADHYRTGESISGQLEEIQFRSPSKRIGDSWVAAFAGPMYSDYDVQRNDEDVPEETFAAVSEPDLPGDLETRLTHGGQVVT